MAQTASTPAASEGLSTAVPAQSPIENQPLHSSPGRTAGADSGISPGTSAFDATHVLGALALVLLLIFGLRFVARKMFALPTVRTSPLVKILARSPVSPKQQVLLLHVGRRILVVADSGSAMQPLAQITDADEIAALLGQLSNNSALARQPFGSLFNRLRRDFDPDESDLSTEGALDRVDMPKEDDPPPPADAGVAQTTEELHGLMEKVRLLSSRLGRT